MGRRRSLNPRGTAPQDRMTHKVYVAGHSGMVGSAIVRRLLDLGNSRESIVTRDHGELDLTDQAAVRAFFAEVRPAEVYLAAARVGGIHANDVFPAEFIYQNLMIEANVIHEAFGAGVRKLLFLGSSCIYPRLAAQPIREDALLGGALEPTNEPYAIAKISGIKLCEGYNRQYGSELGVDFRSVMPTNLYGPGDNYHPDNSHVIPGLIRRLHEARQAGATSVSVWGTGSPLREFLHVDDLARACVHVMGLEKARYEAVTSPRLSHINVGSGREVTIRELAGLLAGVVKFRGTVLFDASRHDGAPRKLLDSRRITELGWAPLISLEEGLRQTYQDFLRRYSK
jgi:GDP-L-fucose synthase